MLKLAFATLALLAACAQARATIPKQFIDKPLPYLVQNCWIEQQCHKVATHARAEAVQQEPVRQTQRPARQAQPPQKRPVQVAMVQDRVIRCHQGYCEGDKSLLGTLFGGGSSAAMASTGHTPGRTLELRVDPEELAISVASQVGGYLGGPIVGVAVCTLFTAAMVHGKDVAAGYYWSFHDTVTNVVVMGAECTPILGSVIAIARAAQSGNGADVVLAGLGFGLGFYNGKGAAVVSSVGGTALSIAGSSTVGHKPAPKMPRRH